MKTVDAMNKITKRPNTKQPAPFVTRRAIPQPKAYWGFTGNGHAINNVMANLDNTYSSRWEQYDEVLMCIDAPECVPIFERSLSGPSYQQIAKRGVAYNERS